GPKVVIIAPAERMNAAAANALLKTLEEPPPRTYIMLVSDQPRRIPVTLTSRCRRVPLARPAPAPAIEWLAAQRVASPELMLAQAGGAPLLALALADAEVQRERSFWLSALSQPARLAPVQLAARIDAMPRDARRMLLARVVDWLIAWCGDIAALRAGSRDLRNPDHTAALGTLAGAVAPLPLFRYHRALLGQRALLSHPLQPRLVAEALLIEYRTLFT
ncbi:MAG TPA: DNA polymerase III subunit delta', partial [Casimicrobiaceae bacterium]|nr:DNA polymerase III subunit delta' [Casimicrobiaceae bacterium]